MHGHNLEGAVEVVPGKAGRRKLTWKCSVWCPCVCISVCAGHALYLKVRMVPVAAAIFSLAEHAASASASPKAY